MSGSDVISRCLKRWRHISGNDRLKLPNHGMIGIQSFILHWSELMQNTLSKSFLWLPTLLLLSQLVVPDAILAQTNEVENSGTTALRIQVSFAGCQVYRQRRGRSECAGHGCGNRSGAGSRTNYRGRPVIPTL